MDSSWNDLARRARTWVDEAAAAGWLDATDVQRFDALESGTPADLFTGGSGRPLVVALFGGTGVGKSSLLNRLAGGQLARTGVERPTSREVTLYVHESIDLSSVGPLWEGEALPEPSSPQSKNQSPKSRVSVVRHCIDSRRDVLWIDAPDIDSAEPANRRLALAWLPHVDLLIYVVSPERYRDDVGWRVLRERGHRHGWMFVLNRWDEGDARQVDDLRQILRRAGFENPLMLSTSCAPRAAKLPSADQFDQLEAAIRRLLAEHGLRELERLGHRARLRELRETLEACLPRLGDAAEWERIAAWCAQRWNSAVVTLREGLAWPMAETAARFAVRGGGMSQAAGQLRTLAANAVGLPSIGSRSPDEKARQTAPGDPRSAGSSDIHDLTRNLWDDWAEARLGEFADAAEIELRRKDIAPTPLRRGFELASGHAASIVLRHVQEHLRLALARPGRAWQRGLRKLTRVGIALLPLLALLTVGVQVVLAYYRASTGGGAFLGQDFAIHSVLLVLVSWAVPFTLDRLLKPSLEKSALNGMQSGLTAGLNHVGDEMQRAVAESAAESAALRANAQRLIEEIATAEQRPLQVAGESLPRVIAAPRIAAAG